MDLIPVVDLSPLPIVDLDKCHAPKSGLQLDLNGFCKKKFFNSSACAEFYAGLKTKADGFHACPFGFTGFKFSVEGRPFAFTGFIPFPRIGTDLESTRAKDHKETKIARDAVNRTATALVKAQETFSKAYQNGIKKYPAAFHEIIKLNGAVKQNAELLLQDYPDSDYAKTIFSSAELMSRQFEILELVANQDLAGLPVKARSALKQLVFKCIKIFEAKAVMRRVRIERSLADGNILVCDKTFPIIPNVLIDNAIRYALENSVITVDVLADSESLTFQVRNWSEYSIDQSAIFARGYRANPKVEGSGYGLYLAQMVARQHGTQITCHQEKGHVTFSIKLKRIS